MSDSAIAPSPISSLPSGVKTRRRGAGSGRESRLPPYFFVATAMVVVIGTNVMPLASTLWDSVHQNSLLSTKHPFVGLGNYISVLEDPAFQTALINTLEYVVLGIVGVIVLGLAFALWVRNVKHGKGLLIMLIVIPWAVPGTVNGAIWALILNPSSGFLNSMLKQLHLVGGEVLWLQGAGALPLISLTLIWQALPIGMLIMLAGLENIPQELNEQMRVDGAGPFRAFWSVILPLLRPVLAITIVQTAITGINIFDQIYVLNGNAPATLSIVQQTYIYAFKNLDFGFGVSAAVISTVLSLIVTLGAFAFVYREVEY